MLVRCKNVAICDEDYVGTCPHSQPHEPTLIEAVDTPFICTEQESDCQPGWSEFSPVICIPLTREEESLYWLKKLYEFIDSNGVVDEENNEGDGYVVRSRSSEFAALLDRVQIFIYEAPSTVDGQ